MSKPQTFTAEDQVQPAPHPDPVPLAPEGCDGDWKDCLDAGHAQGPTSMHRNRGWRAVRTAKP